MPLLELRYFESSNSNGEIELNWLTEDSPKKFEVEHSIDDLNWKSLGTINSTPKKEYQFTHSQPHTGLNYYRLKYWDENGGLGYSDVISEYLDINFAIYPNPSKGLIQLRGKVESNFNLEIYDAKGNLIRSEYLSTDQIDISDLPSAIYFLHIKIDAENYEFKIVKE